MRTEFGKLLEGIGISLEGIQVHHNDELAKKPAEAIRTSNLEFRKGNAATVGSGHHFAGEVSKAHEAGVKEPGAHVVKKMNAQGVDPDVPELGPSLLRSALHVFIVASAGMKLLESGSVSEGAKSLLEGYATDKLVTTVTTDVLGAELASSMIPVVGFAFGLCGDSTRSCEEQARMRALGDLQDEIDERAARIVDEEPGAQMSFARERVIRQMLAERGLDKVREQCDPTKACCAKSPDFKIQFNPQMPVLTGNGPSMSARYW